MYNFSLTAIVQILRTEYPSSNIKISNAACPSKVWINISPVDMGFGCAIYDMDKSTITCLDGDWDTILEREYNATLAKFEQQFLEQGQAPEITDNDDTLIGIIVE